MYELYDPCTVMFFYRWVGVRQWHRRLLITLSSNKHIMIDLGTGNNNKMFVSILWSSVLWLKFDFYRNWAMDNKQEVRLSLYYSLNVDTN